MSEGVYETHKKISFPMKSYGVVIKPEPVYQFPETHPCHGCVFILRINKPNCMTGSYPDTKNCVNAFYKKLISKQKTEYKVKPEEVDQ